MVLVILTSHMGVPLPVLAIVCIVQFPAYAAGMAAEDGPRAQAANTHSGYLVGLSGSQLEVIPDLAVANIGRQ